MAMSKKDIARKSGKKKEKIEGLEAKASSGDAAAKKKLAKLKKK
ncbi:hypothetical protein [Methanococcoides alaskense]|uniref:Uncharacterized protein n=1 Tax=Methanococcoides alaskense TaxID=325778 RepID=A0AA90U0G2_9EURY|nr:hypothetical protein [Methanococcoides alaskense]MDR6223301.1 hypothetical protein [Methanococcoides alaskense]